MYILRYKISTCLNISLYITLEYMLNVIMAKAFIIENLNERIRLSLMISAQSPL